MACIVADTVLSGLSQPRFVLGARAQVTNTLKVSSANVISGYTSPVDVASLQSSSTCLSVSNDVVTSVRLGMQVAHESAIPSQTHTVRVWISKSANGGSNSAFNVTVRPASALGQLLIFENGFITTNDTELKTFTFTTQDLIDAGVPNETSFLIDVTGTSNGTGGNQRTSVVCAAELDFITANAPPFPPVVAPTTQASNIQQGNPSAANQQRLNWTNGNGAVRLVLMREGSSADIPSPVNNTTYTADAVFGTAGSEVPSGWFAVYNGTESTVLVTGLNNSTTYTVRVL
jgi:hypothetical protein